MKLQIRVNQKGKYVELRTSRHTVDSGALQKAEDFLRAFMLGFSGRQLSAFITHAQ